MFAFYDQLSAEAQDVYRRSDGICAIRVPRAESMRPLLLRLSYAVKRQDRKQTEVVSQLLATTITSRLHVAPVEIQVHTVRPPNHWSHTHGLYRPAANGAPACIDLWYRTRYGEPAVSFRTFVRMLLHEICHHLDLVLLELPVSLHTEGLYQRESSLLRQLISPIASAASHSLDFPFSSLRVASCMPLGDCPQFSA